MTLFHRLFPSAASVAIAAALALAAGSASAAAPAGSPRAVKAADPKAAPAAVDARSVKQAALRGARERAQASTTSAPRAPGQDLGDGDRFKYDSCGCSGA